MRQDLHKELIAETEELRTLLSKYPAEAIVGTCAMFFLHNKGLEARLSELNSPARQLFFMLGLMLTTPEPQSKPFFDRATWKKATQLLNSIFELYGWMFFPESDEVEGIDDRWRHVRKVAMPAFLHYFNTSILASVEQVANRIRKYLIPFDKELESINNINASDALAITSWIETSLQSKLEEFLDTIKKEEMLRLSILERAQKEQWTDEQIREESIKRNWLHFFEKINTPGEIFRVKYEDICKSLGEPLASSYWALFVSCRGSVPSFTYRTEENAAEQRSLFEVEDKIAVCPSVNALYNSLLYAFENSIEHSVIREKYLKRRDQIFEQEVSSIFKSFFDEGLVTYQNVYETAKCENEHDLIIHWNRYLFIVEAKASPPIEPFRDPEKAFTRIKRAFNSDTGIQKGFDQGNRIRRRLLSEDYLSLYSEDGSVLVKLDAVSFERIFCICVTRDDFGPLAIDLSLLLKKDDSEEYPWCVNIFDLHTLLDSWNYLEFGPEKLVTYLEQRMKLHGRVFSDDELDIAGFEILYDDFNSLLKRKDAVVMVDTTYSLIFDEMYYCRKLGEEFDLDSTRAKISKILKEKNDVITNAKPGRNKPCPCGSGTKYKHCHGR